MRYEFLLPVSLAFANEEEGVSLEHRSLAVERLERVVWEKTLALTLPADTVRLAVVVEDLVSGVWGGSWVDF